MSEEKMNGKLTREQLAQVAGGKVGDVFSGWPCLRCGSRNTTVTITEDRNTSPRADGTYDHCMTYLYKCTGCGGEYYNHESWREYPDKQ